MANTLTEVTPKLLAAGLTALREQAIMPLLVNRQYETMAGQKGSTVDVPIPSAIAVQDVTPANTPPSTADVAPTSVPIAMTRWKEAPFYMTDKDLLTAMDGTLPMQASEAIKALANEVDQYILSLGNQFYGVVGTAGTTPFGSGVEVASASQARVRLNQQLAPMNDRRLVLDPDAEGAALELRSFHDASFGVGGQAILDGKITNRFGLDFFMDQNVQSHTTGIATGTTLAVDLGAGYAIGSTTIHVDGATAAASEGDVIKFANHDQYYVVTADSVLATADTDLVIYPPLQAAVVDDEAITIVASHVMNLAFQRDAIAFASRPLMQEPHPAAIEQSVVDPISGLALRLEITREHKRTRYSYDILYGAAVVRRELGVRLLG